MEGEAPSEPGVVAVLLFDFLPKKSYLLAHERATPSIVAFGSVIGRRIFILFLDDFEYYLEAGKFHG